MILKITTNFSFAKLKDKYKDIQKDFISESINKEAINMKKRVATGTTVSGTAMKPIQHSTVLVRSLNKHSMNTPPLNASGKLRNSIKATKTGVSFKKYGIYHNEEYTVKTNPVIPPKGRAVSKGLKKQRFYFAGKTVPARKWMHDTESYKADQKVLKNYFRRMNKALKK